MKSSIQPQSTRCSSRHPPTRMPATCDAPPTANLPVLCEKPIDLDFARAADGGPIRQRPAAFSPWSTSTVVSTATTRSCERVVASGDVGKVQLIQMTTRGPSLPPLELHRRLGRPDARPDRALLRPGAGGSPDEDPEAVFATGSTLDRAEAARVRRRRHVRGHPAVAQRRAGADRQRAPDRLRLRRTHRGARIDRHGRSAPPPGRRGIALRPGMSSTTACTTGWFERIAASYRAALDHFVDALERRTARSAPPCQRR